MEKQRNFQEKHWHFLRVFTVGLMKFEIVEYLGELSTQIVRDEQTPQIEKCLLSS